MVAAVRPGMPTAAIRATATRRRGAPKQLSAPTPAHPKPPDQGQPAKGAG